MFGTLRIVVLLIIAIGCAFSVFAQQATQEKMATEALIPHVGANVPERAERVIRERQRLAANTVVRPDEIRSATFVFSQGVDKNDVLGFAARHNLTVIGFHLKAPIDDHGHILSVGVGMDDFLAVNGDAKDRFRYAIELQRARIRDLARGYSQSPIEQDQEKAKGYKQIAEGKLPIFTIDALGTSRALSEASSEDHVAGAFLDEGNAKVRDFQARSNRQ